MFIPALLTYCQSLSVGFLGYWICIWGKDSPTSDSLYNAVIASVYINLVLWCGTTGVCLYHQQVPSTLIITLFWFTQVIAEGVVFSLYYEGTSVIPCNIMVLTRLWVVNFWLRLAFIGLMVCSYCGFKVYHCLGHRPIIIVSDARSINLNSVT